MFYLIFFIITSVILLFFIFRNHHRMMNMKKGVILAWKTPTLPDNILKLTMHPLIRILRVLGGISLLILLSNRVLIFPTYLQYYIFIICLFIASIFTIYHLYLTYHRIKHIRFLIKNGAFDIRNSPLDRFVTVATKLLACAKGACETAIPVGNSLGLMLGYDALLEHQGHEPVFKPILAGILLPNSEADIKFKERQQYFRDMAKVNKEYAAYEEEVAFFTSLKGQNTFFNAEDIQTIEKGFQEHGDLLIKRKNDLVKKISDSLSSK